MRNASLPRTLVLWNPQAGRAAVAADAREWLQNLTHVEVQETSSDEHAGVLAQAAGDRHFERVLAAGGDGTVNAIVNGLIESRADVSLAILPIGTANDFALTLAMPDDPMRAAEICLSESTRRIDVAQYETSGATRHFANVAAGGNSDQVTRCLTPEQKDRWGAFCYLRGAIEVLGDLTTYRARVRFDDESELLHLDLWNVIIANGRTNAGHLAVAPRANPEDGLLDVVLIRDGTTADLAGLMARFLTSDYLDSPQVLFRQVRRLAIDSVPPMRYSFDGEAIDQQPVIFRCLPGALAMIVGPDYAANPADLDVE